MANLKAPLDGVRRISKRIFNRKEKAKAEKEAEESKTKDEESLPPAPKGSTQSGDRKASSQPAKPRKLQKKPPGTSKPQEPWRNMKPIGEYPSPAEYRSAGVTPSAKRVAERVANPLASAPRKELEFETVGSDSGVENPTVEKGHVEYLAKAVTFASPTPDIETPDIETPDIETPDIETPDIETPDETTPTIATVVPSLSQYMAVLDAIPLPAKSKYDINKLRACVKFSLIHAVETKNHPSAATVLYFWSHACNNEFELGLIYNLHLGAASDEQQLNSLRCQLLNEESDALKWYENYIGVAAVEVPDGSDSGVSTANPPGPGRGFKVSDIYRDTSGPRLEEQFMSGKTNTAPIKRPKKPCPVNEKAYKRKREWESDPHFEAGLEEKRARYRDAQTTAFADYAVGHSDCREERGPPNAIEQYPLTFDDTPIERSRSLPVGGSILDIQLVKGPESPAPSVYSTNPSVIARRAGTTQTVSRHQKEKAKHPEMTGRARSLSIDTTVSTLSSLSNSAYSVRFNDWTADHEPRQMPNSIEPPDNSDDCHQCGKGGDLLCCDTCENSYHFTCLKPALDPKNPPQGEWHCPKCSIRNTFSTLIAHSNHFKKTEYQVPKDIQDFFLGTDEAVIEDKGYPRKLTNQRFYKPAPHLPRLTKAPKQDVPVYYTNPQLLREYDNKGDPIKCSRCGFNSNGVRPIITCDYCPCRFHLDCLDPPRAQPPNPKIGWMCPNHVTPEDMIATKEVDGYERTRRVRRKQNMATIDCDILLPDDPNASMFDEDWREKRKRAIGSDVALNFIAAVKEDNYEREKRYAARVEQKCLDLTRQLTLEFLEKQRLAGANELATEVIPTFFSKNISGSIRSMIAAAPTSTRDFDAASALLGISRNEPEPGLQDPTVTTSPALATQSPTKTASAASSESEKSGSEDLAQPPVVKSRKRSRDDHGVAEGPAQKRPHTDSE